jgi:dienelactone hydrolase
MATATRTYLLALLLLIFTALSFQQTCAQKPNARADALSNTGPIESELNEEIVRLPITAELLNGNKLQRTFVLTVFKPDGAGPFPTVIVSHGRDIATRATFGRSRDLRYYFVRRGFAVLVPTRVSYGISGFDVDLERVREEACDLWQYEPLAKNVTLHIEAAIAYAKRQSWFDPRQLIVAGYSAGGFGSLVAAGEIKSDIRAVINFAGGTGGLGNRPEQPCNPGDIGRRLASAASTKALPTIWFYSENDRYWGKQIPRRWQAAYRDAGGLAEFYMFPPLGANGHNIIDPGIKLWRPKLDRFLTGLGFSPHKSPKGTPLPSLYADLDDISSVPLIDEKGRKGYKEFLEADVPRAFAIGPDGSWASRASLHAIDDTLKACRQFARTPCQLYAVNDDVVWRPEAGGQFEVKYP